MYKKKLVTLLIMVLLLMSTTSAFASEITTPGNASSDVLLTAAGATFSVTVPMTLPVEVDAEGVVTIASNVMIINNSVGSVEVTDISFATEPEWSVVAYGTDMSAEAVGAKKISFSINGDTTTAGGFNFTGSGFSAIAGNGGTAGIVYDAEVPAQATALMDAKVATVVFTIGWAQ